ncbi:HAAS signaling domain-containing protein [Paenibacillus sp. 2TAB19]|uniref:HAAS signaling domain-containing protein n=1 Tax=Paenibacillus sp. 2TAB19 TaxID=3233003 RepID=UPI003F9E6F72
MMTKQSYMNELNRLLRNVSEEQRKEWLYDYYLHFEQAAQNGQSEEEAALELGDPRHIAGELLLGYRVEQAETSKTYRGLSRAVFATVSLGLFNLIFIIGPYVALAAVLLSMWAVALSIAFVGFATIADSFWVETFTKPQALSLALICFSVSILLGIGLKKLTSLFYIMTLKYLKFNTRVVRGNSK